MTQSESCCHRPRSRFSVTIDRRPSPENTGGRLTRSHGTNARVRRLPVTFDTNRDRGSQPRLVAALPALAYARGTELSTTRIVPPFWRASAKDPSNVSVRVTFI